MDACCTDYTNLKAVYDLRKISLLDAWNGERMTKLRREHLSKIKNDTACWYCINNQSLDKAIPLNEELYHKQ